MQRKHSLDRTGTTAHTEMTRSPFSVLRSPFSVLRSPFSSPRNYLTAFVCVLALALPLVSCSSGGSSDDGGFDPAFQEMLDDYTSGTPGGALLTAVGISNLTGLPAAGYQGYQGGGMGIWVCYGSAGMQTFTQP